VAPVGADQIVEVPLTEWRDVGGSKLHVLPATRSLLALAGIRRRVAGRRKLSPASGGGAGEAGR
jgi:hypothetical protein